jgi:hypothetical protein
MQKNPSKNSTSFHNKSCDEARNRRNAPQHKKGYIYMTANSQHHTQWRKTDNILSKVRKEPRVSTLSTLIQHSLRIPSQSSNTGRRNKRNTN